MYICVLIHIWTKGEVGAPLNRFKPFTDRSKAVLLLWVIYIISVLFCYAFMHVCLLMPRGHLLEKGWPLGSRLWCLIVTLSLSHWYPGSGVVLDCVDSWSLPSILLLKNQQTTKIMIFSSIQRANCLRTILESILNKWNVTVYFDFYERNSCIN